MATGPGPGRGDYLVVLTGHWPGGWRGAFCTLAPAGPGVGVETALARNVGQSVLLATAVMASLIIRSASRLYTHECNNLGTKKLSKGLAAHRRIQVRVVVVAIERQEEAVAASWVLAIRRRADDKG